MNVRVTVDDQPCGSDGEVVCCDTCVDAGGLEEPTDWIPGAERTLTS